MKPEAVAKIAVAYSGFVWGLFWIPVRTLDGAGVHGLWGLLVFYLVPGLLILPVLALRWRQNLAGGRWLVLIGLATSVPLVCYSIAVLYTDVIRAMLLFYLTPVWSTILGWLFLNERITPVRCIAIALAILGILVIFGIDERLPWPENAGDWAALASGLGWAVASVLLRFDRGTHALEFTVQNFLWSAIAMMGIAFLFAAAPAPSLALVTAQLWWLAPTLIVVVMTGVYAALWGAPKLSPGLVGLLFMTEISVGAITAAIWSGDPFGMREVTGILLISLAGILESVIDVWRAGAKPATPA
ncbi:MAG: DMT family transporter [Hyphomicrobiales bacterium]